MRQCQVGCFTVLLMAAALASNASAQSYEIQDAFPHLTFAWPVELKQAPGDSTHLYVVEWSGRILRVEHDSSARTSDVFLDLRDRAIAPQGEAGLIGLAFHPDFVDNGQFFVSYVDKSQPQLLVSRFGIEKANAAVGDPESEEVLLAVEQMNYAHNGGQLKFGPDGYLYVGLGDGGVGDSTAETNGQNLSTLQGSILRVDVDEVCCSLPYGIPPDNPFADRSDGTRREIFAYGLRNPWRLSFDRETGELWVGDVGAARWEEINKIKKGGNYGWSIKEGSECYKSSDGCEEVGMEPSIWEYSHQDGVAIIGGFVYRGDSHPELRGKYLFSDYDAARLSNDGPYQQKVWSLESVGVDSVNVSLIAEPNLHRVLAISETLDGEMLIGALYSEDGQRFHGDVFHLTSSVTQAVEALRHPHGRISSSYPNPFRAATEIEYVIEAPAFVDLVVYDIQGRRVRTLASGFQNPGEYRVRWHAEPDSGEALASGTYFVRLRIGDGFEETISVTHIK